MPPADRVTCPSRKSLLTAYVATSSRGASGRALWTVVRPLSSSQSTYISPLTQNDEVPSTWGARVAPLRTFTISSSHDRLPTALASGPMGVTDDSVDGTTVPSGAMGGTDESVDGTDEGAKLPSGPTGALDVPSPVIGRPCCGSEPGLIAQYARPATSATAAAAPAGTIQSRVVERSS